MQIQGSGWAGIGFNPTQPDAMTGAGISHKYFYSDSIFFSKNWYLSLVMASAIQFDAQKKATVVITGYVKNFVMLTPFMDFYWMP